MNQMENVKNKLYVLIDQNLDPIYGAVQGGHAVAQFLIDYGQNKWSNEYLIYVSVDINKWEKLLNDSEDLYNTSFSKFYEPDLDNRLTSIAVHTEDFILERKLKKEKLL